MREIASGLKFPEGPIAMPDGSVVLVEIAGGSLTRISADGERRVIADLGGGPNGAALGPDGMIYVCNNGGFRWHEMDGMLFPGRQADDYSGGRIERVDPRTGEFEALYTEVDGRPLKGPNDLVFDRHGGFWFTDHGKIRKRDKDHGGVYYASPDGRDIREVIFPLDSPNGIGLSPAEDRLYVAETVARRVWAYDIVAPGEIRRVRRFGGPGDLVAGLPGNQMLDSLAIDAEGNVCVATLMRGGITSISPDGERQTFSEMGDPMTTNICFGGEGLRTAYVTLSASGRLVALEWPVAGLPLNFLNR
ncbi:SMP-30/gluconolactonase/LRE family protein [Ectothiorhodospiraceae bacterium WFHF3C12]|nr:SMP-30/gluconolactonase/LRE family protein [Ectothiorhodospiraceae bacterium WFHF3C12]